MKKQCFLWGLGALSGVFIPTFALADAPAQMLIQKSPHGVGYLVKDDDSILAPMPANPKYPALVKPDPALLQNIIQFSDEMLTMLSEKTDDKDTQFYENATWHHKLETAIPDRWVYAAGPAGLAAQMWRWREAHPETMDAAAKARQPWLKKVAVETFDKLIKDFQLPNGDLKNIGNSHREFFTIDFISTYLIFKDSLDAETKQRWVDAMKIQVDWMMKNGDLPNPDGPGWKATDGWYTNGNVEISEISWLYLMWQATGEQKYLDLLEVDWKHTLKPTPVRWNGYGLYYFKVPTKADGSDGTAYVTEAAAAPGFDPGYSSLQLSMIARQYLKSRDPRALKLTNVIFNNLWPRIDKDTYILDATYGSRHSETFEFMNCAPMILAWTGGRSDLLPSLPDVFNKGIKPILARNARENNSDPRAYRSVGFELAALIEAAYLVDVAQKTGK